MIAAQAIKNTMMDLMAPSGMSSSVNNFESSSTKRKDVVSFETMLSNRSILNQGMHESTSENVTSTSTKRNEEPANTNKLTNESKEAKTDRASQPSVKEKPIQNVAKESDVTKESEVTKESDITEESSLDKIAKTIEEVKEIVLDQLNISEEQLVSMMQVLGLTMVDLLNPEALKQLTLTNAGTNDFMMLLTDEGLGMQATNLTNQVQKVIDDSGITPLELTDLNSNEHELAKLMEVLNTKQEDTTFSESLQVSLTPKNFMDEETIKTGGNENILVTSGGKADKTTESQIEFSVERVMQGTEDHTQNTTNSDASKHQGQEYGQAELTNQFLDQMVNSTQTTKGEFTQQLQQMSELREVANQILEQIKLVIKPAQTSMELTLNPEHLGKVALNITSKEGMITATFTAQNQIAKEAIESQMQIFKENLYNQGIKVEAIEVNVSNFSFEGSTQMDQSSSNQQESSKDKKSALRIDMDDAAFLEESMSLLTNDTVDYGNNIDYTA